MANPMADFKKSLTREYVIQGKKFLFRTLTSSEKEEIEKQVERAAVNLADDSKFWTRKHETLAKSIVSIDGMAINKFPEIQVKIQSNPSLEKEYIVEEISSWDNELTTMLYNYYNILLIEKNKKYKDELDFLNSQNTEQMN